MGETGVDIVAKKDAKEYLIIAKTSITQICQDIDNPQQSFVSGHR